MKFQIFVSSHGGSFDPEDEALMKRAHMGGDRLSETWQIEPVRQDDSPKGVARPVFSFVVKSEDHAEIVIQLCKQLHYRFHSNCPGFCCGKIASAKDYAAVKRWLDA